MFKNKPISQQDAASRLDKYFHRLLYKGRHSSSIQVLVDCEKRCFRYQYAAGTMTAEQNTPVANNQPFHMASIGKVFTAVLIQMLASEGRLALRDPITKYFEAPELHPLFVYKNEDFADRVTIEHLLSHTSGIADYFSAPAKQGTLAFTDRVTLNPDEYWTPQSLLDYSKEHQTTAGPPGEQFHYSDTGYILLGQIIERVTGKAFHEGLHERIFDPLGMDSTYLMFYSQPKQQPALPIQDIWLNGTEVSRFQSMSCDWAGGGIITTPEDLLKFAKALHKGRLVSQDTLKSMEAPRHKFRSGIYYGLGMMEIRFEQFFFLLRGLPRLKGHIGVLATHLFYDPSEETYFIMNFGSTTRMVHSFQALIQLVTLLKKLKPERVV